MPASATQSVPSAAGPVLPDLFVVTADIAASGTDADIVSGDGRALLAIEIPATWTTSNVTLRVGWTPAGGGAATMGALRDQTGTLIFLSVAAGERLTLPGGVILPGVDQVQLVSVTAQGSGRTVKLIFADLAGRGR